MPKITLDGYITANGGNGDFRLRYRRNRVAEEEAAGDEILTNDLGFGGRISANGGNGGDDRPSKTTRATALEEEAAGKDIHSVRQKQATA
jgi:hypothetical protein